MFPSCNSAGGISAGRSQSKRGSQSVPGGEGGPGRVRGVGGGARAIARRANGSARAFSSRGLQAGPLSGVGCLSTAIRQITATP